MFFFFGDKIKFTPSASKNPQAFMDQCIKNSIKESETLILQSNGFTKIEDNFILYNKEKVPYLCTTAEFYTSCTPQEPAFLNSIQTLMENKVSRDAENCFIQLTDDLESSGYSVTREKSGTSIAIRKGEIFASTNNSIVLRKDEISTEIAPMQVSYSSGLFDLIKTAQTIVNYESSLCEFDLINWQRFENPVKITRFRTSDQTKIYTLTDRISDKQIKFAVRTCIMPAGI